MFLFIAALTFVIQVGMVNFGGRAVRVVPLTMSENLVCLGIGSFSLIWSIIVKLILPPRLFNRLAINEKEMTDAEEKETVQTLLKKSFRQSTLGRSLRSNKELNSSKIWGQQSTGLN